MRSTAGEHAITLNENRRKRHQFRCRRRWSVELVKAYARCAQSRTSLHKVLLETVLILIGLKTHGLFSWAGYHLWHGKHSLITPFKLQIKYFLNPPKKNNNKQTNKTLNVIQQLLKSTPLKANRNNDLQEEVANFISHRSFHVTWVIKATLRTNILSPWASLLFLQC